MTENLPVKQEENRDSLGRFKEGKTGNPNGRPKGSIMQLVDQAIEEVETAKDKSLLKHLVERAYTSDKVLIAIMNKLIPNAKPKEIEEKENVNIEVRFSEGREEEQCLAECFDIWKANKEKALNN